MQVDELAPGLWRWTSRIPGRGETASFYIEREDSIVLLDPVVPPEDRAKFLDALDRDATRHGGPLIVALTSASRVAAADELIERYDARSWRPGDPRPLRGIGVLDGGRDGNVMLFVRSARALYDGGAFRRTMDGVALRSDRDLARVRHSLGAVIAYGVSYLLLADDAPVTSAADSVLAASLAIA